MARDTIKKLLCQLGTILTLVWASNLLLANPIIIQINDLVNTNFLTSLLGTSFLLLAGFKLLDGCSFGRCKE